MAGLVFANKQVNSLCADTPLMGNDRDSDEDLQGFMDKNMRKIRCHFRPSGNITSKTCRICRGINLPCHGVRERICYWYGKKGSVFYEVVESAERNRVNIYILKEPYDASTNKLVTKNALWYNIMPGYQRFTGITDGEL
ncbi:MAG: hypothetical protein PVG39_02260 [Desulfobacteraceae bacterium]|jgi:hypothetical protein